MAKRVLLLGAQGVLGAFVARELAAHGFAVVRAGRRNEVATDFRFIDLDDSESLPQAFRDCDLVVSTVPHSKLSAERTVLEHGGTLLNVASLLAVQCEQMEQQVGEPRGLVAVHGGMGPGLANLNAADLLRRHQNADTVEIGMTLSATGTSGVAGVKWVYGLFTQGTHHSTRLVHLPKPFGARRCFRLALAKEGWLRGVGGSFEQHLLLCVSERWLQLPLIALNRLGLNSWVSAPPFTLRHKGIPDHLTTEPVCHWAAVYRDGRCLEARTVEARGDYRTTAIAAGVFAEALLFKRGSYDLPSGVKGVHEIFPFVALKPEFESRGLKFTEQASIYGPPFG